MPVNHALRPEDVVPLRLDIAELEQNPFQVSRLRFQDLFEYVEIFRRMHSIDAEVEGAGGEAVLARDRVEDFRRSRIIEPARADDDGIEFVLVLGEEFQFRRDPFRDHGREERVDSRARRDERRERNRDVDEFFWKLDTHWWIVRSARDVTSPGSAGNLVIERSRRRGTRS